jgi:hypothetical protein
MMLPETPLSVLMAPPVVAVLVAQPESTMTTHATITASVSSRARSILLIAMT